MISKKTDRPTRPTVVPLVEPRTIFGLNQKKGFKILFTMRVPTSSYMDFVALDNEGLKSILVISRKRALEVHYVILKMHEFT